MGEFLSELKLTPQDDGIHWRVDAEFSYKTTAGEIIAVPEGRLTDLASTPRILWNIYPPFGRYLGPAVIHDELYTTQVMTKEKSDLIFLEAMIYKQVWPLTRWNLYHAVKWFGFTAWHQHTLELPPKIAPPKPAGPTLSV